MTNRKHRHKISNYETISKVLTNILDTRTINLNIEIVICSEYLEKDMYFIRQYVSN